MSLDTFFTTIGPFLTGDSDVAALERTFGPLPSGADDYRFYQHLLEYDHQRDLALLYPATRAAVDRAGVNWWSLCAEFFRACPPRGYSVPHLGEGFADWLTTRRHPQLPAGIDALTDLTWTRFLARTASDGDDVGLNRRLFIRHYTTDPVAARRAAHDGSEWPAPKPTTWLVYRCVQRGTVYELGATRATVAVLLDATGAPVPEPLRLTDDAHRDERRRLVRHGVLSPSPAEESAG